MNKNIIIVLVIIVAAFFVWKFVPMGSAPVNVPVTTEDTSVTAPKMEDGTVAATINSVIYDGTKFTPSTMTVKQGDSITFVNDSTGGMSVASDPHPAHTIYPEFDQYKTSAKGQKTFTFTFEKIGTWGYHNHLNSSAVGSVTVTAK